jgi:hypothetical protein
MERPGSTKGFNYTARLPEEILHMIFSKLNTREIINAGMVCGEWDKLVKAGTPATRHWVTPHNLDNTLSRIPFLESKGSNVDQLTIDMGRYADTS